MQTRKLAPFFLIVFLVLSLFCIHPAKATESTFGYTTIGILGNAFYTSYAYATNATLTDNNAEITKISMHCAASTGTRTVHMGIYNAMDNSTGLPTSLIATTNEVSVSTTKQWWNFTFSSNPTLDAGTYYFACAQTNTINVNYTSTAANSFAQYDTVSAQTFNDPWSQDGTKVRGYISIFATYTISGGQNLLFDLTAVPTITATLNSWKEIFKSLAQAPAFTSSITYGLELLFNLAEIPAVTSSLVYGRALAYGLSEIPKFIADLVAEKGKNAIFDLSIIPAFIADFGKNMELKRSLSEVPKFIVDMTKLFDLSIVEFALAEVPIFTATLGFLVETGMTTGDLANGAIALALIALVFAVCGIGLAVKKTSD